MKEISRIIELFPPPPKKKIKHNTHTRIKIWNVQLVCLLNWKWECNSVSTGYNIYSIALLWSVQEMKQNEEEKTEAIRGWQWEPYPAVKKKDTGLLSLFLELCFYLFATEDLLWFHFLYLFSGPDIKMKAEIWPVGQRYTTAALEQCWCIPIKRYQYITIPGT